MEGCQHAAAARCKAPNAAHHVVEHAVVESALGLLNANALADVHAAPVDEYASAQPMPTASEQ